MKYCYNQHYYRDDIDIKHITTKVIELSREEVLNSYWDYWFETMLDRGYFPEQLTEEKCIQDWCFIHMAWEKND